MLFVYKRYSIGASIEVFTDSSGTLTGLFFQDGIMKSVYSEVTLVDATYDVRMPLHLYLSIDGNGNSEIILVFLTTRKKRRHLCHGTTI